MKLVLISFFNSNNIGDLALSSALEELVKLKYSCDIVKYDFLTLTKVDVIKKKNAVLVDEPQKISDSRFRLVMKNTLFKLFGVRNVSLLAFQFRKFRLGNIKQLSEEFADTDKIIIGGGNMLMDISPAWPLILRDIANLAHRKKIPYDIVFVGAGPIIYEKSKFIYSKVLSQANLVSVRGKKSKTVLEDLNSCLKILETIDPVFSLDIDFYSTRISQIKNRLEYKQRLNIGICVISEVCFKSHLDFETYLNFIKTTLVKLSSKFNVILFSTEAIDYAVIGKLETYLNGNDIKIPATIEYVSSEDEVKALYTKLDYLIGGRMHALIFAQKCLLPYMGVIWQDKIVEFSEITNSRNFVYTVEELFNLDVEKLIHQSSISMDRISQMHEKNTELKHVVLNSL